MVENAERREREREEEEVVEEEEREVGFVSERGACFLFCFFGKDSRLLEEEIV